MFNDMAERSEIFLYLFFTILCVALTVFNLVTYGSLFLFLLTSNEVEPQPVSIPVQI